MRMSRGPSFLMENPRAAVSSCMEDTPPRALLLSESRGGQ